MNAKRMRIVKGAVLAAAAGLAGATTAQADYVLYQDPAFPSIIYIDAGEPKEKPKLASFGGPATGAGPVTVNGVVQTQADGAPTDPNAAPATGDAAAQGQGTSQPQTFEERTQDTIEVIESGDAQGVIDRAADTAVTAPILGGAELR